MPHRFPDTPKTLISRLKLDEDGDYLRNHWRTFVDLYHAPVRTAVKNAFFTYGWNDPQDHVDDVVSIFFLNIIQSPQQRLAYDKEKGSFRNWLRKQARWRVIDYIRNHAKQAGRYPAIETVAETDLDLETHDATPNLQLLEEENTQFRYATLNALLEDLRTRISPRNFIAFEMSVLQELPVSQVSTELGMTENQIHNIKYRALKILKELSQQSEYTDEA